MTSVCVMMSTYNGEKYIKEQIDSIINQYGVDIKLVVRDDGSSDNTISILEEYEQKGCLSWYSGNNAGPASSFLDLVQHVKENYDFYSFADQDDVWDRDKIDIAIKKIKEISAKYILYNSAVRVTDENLNSLKIKFGPERIYNFQTELLRNNVIGCTVVFNKNLMEEVKKYIPETIPMHDQWIALICLGLGGEIILDENSHMDYRQHGDNAVGTKSNFRDKLRQSTLIKNSSVRSAEAMALIDGYGEFFTKRNHTILKNFVEAKKSYRSKAKIIRLGFNCEKRYQNVLCMYAILTGRY